MVPGKRHRRERPPAEAASVLLSASSIATITWCFCINWCDDTKTSSRVLRIVRGWGTCLGHVHRTATTRLMNHKATPSAALSLRAPASHVSRRHTASDCNKDLSHRAVGHDVRVAVPFHTVSPPAGGHPSAGAPRIPVNPLPVDPFISCELLFEHSAGVFEHDDSCCLSPRDPNAWRNGWRQPALVKVATQATTSTETATTRGTPSVTRVDLTARDHTSQRRLEQTHTELRDANYVTPVTGTRSGSPLGFPLACTQAYGLNPKPTTCLPSTKPASTPAEDQHSRRASGPAVTMFSHNAGKGSAGRRSPTAISTGLQDIRTAVLAAEAAVEAAAGTSRECAFPGCSVKFSHHISPEYVARGHRVAKAHLQVCEPHYRRVIRHFDGHHAKCGDVSKCGPTGVTPKCAALLSKFEAAGAFHFKTFLPHRHRRGGPVILDLAALEAQRLAKLGVAVPPPAPAVPGAGSPSCEAPATDADHGSRRVRKSSRRGSPGAKGKAKAKKAAPKRKRGSPPGIVVAGNAGGGGVPLPSAVHVRATKRPRGRNGCAIATATTIAAPAATHDSVLPNDAAPALSGAQVEARRRPRIHVPCAAKHSARATTPRASPGLALPVPAPQLRHNFTATSPRHALARFPDAAAAVLPVGLRPVSVAPAPVPTDAPIDACVVPRVVSITSITSACWVLPDGDDNLNFSSSDMEDDSVGDSDVSADTTTSLDSSGSCGGQWWTTEAIQLTPVTSPGAGPLQDEWPSTQKLGRVLSASSLELPPLAAPAQRAAGLQPECIVRRLSDEECDVDIGFGAPLFAL